MTASAPLPKTVLCAVDFSPGSADALRQAISLSEAFSAKLVVMHVVPTLDHIVEYGLMASRAADLTTGMLDAAEKRLKAFVADTPGHKEDLSLVACFGEASTTICAEAKNRDAGLIVLSTRGNTGLKHAILGSTAERVVRTAPCPVWTTHALSD